MALSKKAYNAIRRVVHNRMESVPVNAIWQWIHDETSIGSVSSMRLLLTVEDHKKLREWVIHETGSDPLTTEIAGDRTQVAAISRDEKFATENVFSGMLWVSCLASEIPLVQGDAVTPPGTLISVPADDILMNEIKTTVIIENGTVAKDWYKSIVPNELAMALMVYRGHGGTASTVRTWASNLSPDIRKIGYFDFDPSGLGIAIDYNMDAILIPDPLDDSLTEGINNKPDIHDKQLMNRPDLREQLPASCRQVFDWMTSDNRKCAVTQERLMVIGRPLRILELNDDTYS